jgi:hypothetical protein
MPILGYRSHLRHWTRAQSWCIMWFGMSYRISVWEMDLFWDIRRACKADILYDLDNRDVLSDLGHRLRHQLWELDLFWDIKQEHKTDIPYDLGCQDIHFGRWIYFETSNNSTKPTSYIIWDVIWISFETLDKSSKLTSYMIGMAYKTSVLGEGSCLRLRTREENWCPVWFVTSSRTSVVGMWISFKTWDKSTKLTLCVIWDIM